MHLRLATYSDVSAADEIYRHAKEFMKSTGNPTQWSGSYPSEEDIVEGIKNGTSYVVTDGDEIVATLHFEENACDEAYKRIHDGAWLDDSPYAAIHRIAVRYNGRGIVGFCFDECFLKFPNLKIDTHRDNIPMQRALLRAGFKYCGRIYLENGEERLAYQRV